ncbi:isochorismatase family protein [Oecophyllibacter saccharovorans]|uniref:isochorismatase family protein n=1 Tax=Oecophyllibacter saccharovorans TaxID=2558360 RepID=UPI0011709A9F|nr:isochorismatase family protein [Oecophyllibacter saccharovorans]TPW34878.1 isochorismatase family protein [Oecophyllibacter saccharovorans]
MAQNPPVPAHWKGFQPQPGDALLIVDMQADFMPGGALAVPEADQLIKPISRMAENFATVTATRDWHPDDHCSFTAEGGQWPAHARAGSPGAAFAPGLVLPPRTLIWSKGSEKTAEAYSVFQDENGQASGFADKLAEYAPKRLFICGVALEYCVQACALDALKAGAKAGYKVCLFPQLCGSLHPPAATLARLEAAGVALYRV